MTLTSDQLITMSTDIQGLLKDYREIPSQRHADEVYNKMNVVKLELSNLLITHIDYVIECVQLFEREQDKKKAHRIYVSYMTDGHTFYNPEGNTPEDIIEWICSNLKEGIYYTKYGMLPPVRVYNSSGTMLREVGQSVYVYGDPKHDIARVRESAKQWIDAINSDQEVLALFSNRKKKDTQS